MSKSQGMLPGEYMKTALVLVPNENPIEGEITLHGLERRPEMYVVVVRRRETTWRIEVLRATPIDDGVIPHQVAERIAVLRERIVKEQRRDRGRDQAAARAHTDDDEPQPDGI